MCVCVCGGGGGGRGRVEEKIVGGMEGDRNVEREMGEKNAKNNINFRSHSHNDAV